MSRNGKPPALDPVSVEPGGIEASSRGLVSVAVLRERLTAIQAQKSFHEKQALGCEGAIQVLTALIEETEREPDQEDHHPEAAEKAGHPN